MALPTILIDSTTGSDTLASGAGPSTALTGSAAATDGAGTTVTLDGSPDLSNVATDGSHVIFFNDSTAGKRNFGKITAKANSGTPTASVTVSDALALSASGKSWAIGGKRASIGGTTSSKLINNNGGAGDALAGWIMQLASGHSETISSTLSFPGSGDGTIGPITLQGDPNFSVRPLLTFSNNGDALQVPNGTFYIQFRHLELQNSNATKTSSLAIDANVGAGAGCMFENIKIAHSTNKFWRGIIFPSLGIINCEIGYCANIGIEHTNFSNTVGGATGYIRNCYIHDCGSHGILDDGCISVEECIIANNTGDGYQRILTGSSTASTIRNNTFDNNGSDGIELQQASSNSDNALIIENNIFSNNAAYGINFSGSLTDAQLKVAAIKLLNNNFYNNTSGKYNSITSASSEGEQILNPQYVNTAGGNYSIGTNLKALGYPTTNIGASQSSTRSYVDIGVAQRVEQSAGGPVGTNFRGGFVN